MTGQPKDKYKHEEIKGEAGKPCQMPPVWSQAQAGRAQAGAGVCGGGERGRENPPSHEEAVGEAKRGGKGWEGRCPGRAKQGGGGGGQ